jgi:hypothetical protein
MLLELVWDDPIERVVFTVGDQYFSRTSVDSWISAYTHTSFNWPLFSRFERRVPPGERQPFVEMASMLQRADREHSGAFKRLVGDVTDVAHYSPFVQYELGVKLLPPWWGSSLRWNMERVRDRRYAREPNAETPLSCTVAPDDMDARQIQILTSVIRMLADRGTKSVLYVEPCGPQEWRVPGPPGARSAADIAREIGRSTGAQVVDLTWTLGADVFIDSSAHYTVDGNARLAERFVSALRSEE